MCVPIVLIMPIMDAITPRTAATSRLSGKRADGSA